MASILPSTGNICASSPALRGVNAAASTGLRWRMKRTSESIRPSTALYGIHSRS